MQDMNFITDPSRLNGSAMPRILTNANTLLKNGVACSAVFMTTEGESAGVLEVQFGKVGIVSQADDEANGPGACFFLRDNGEERFLSCHEVAEQTLIGLVVESAGYLQLDGVPYPAIRFKNGSFLYCASDAEHNSNGAFYIGSLDGPKYEILCKTTLAQGYKKVPLAHTTQPINAQDRPSLAPKRRTKTRV